MNLVTASHRRIGLFGGSFDPPHLAHLALARLARQALALDELRWLPAGQPWQKAGRPLAPAEHRARMVSLLIEGEPGMQLDRRELLRSGPSYTIDTVRELADEQPGAECFLVIGQDQYANLATWHEVAELLGRVTLAVAAREGQALAAPAALAQVPHRVVALDLPRMDISSTAARRLAAAHTPGALAPLVGGAVARYIDQHRLYRASPPEH